VTDHGLSRDYDWQKEAVMPASSIQKMEDPYGNDFKVRVSGSGRVTKDSGKRQEFESGMRRDTEEGKPTFSLLVPKGVPYEEQILTRFAALLARGAEKYTARNWEQANSEEELERYYSSAFRHFMQWICGEDDEDHAAAVMFNIMCAETLKWKLANGENRL
jgi:hypothetical protein